MEKQRLLFKMTQEEKRIKIGIHCGWKYNSEDPELDFDRWTDTKGVRHLCSPDYFNDLNVMHEEEMTLWDTSYETSISEKYIERLREVCKKQSHYAEVATPTQRANTFGEILNLW